MYNNCTRIDISLFTLFISILKPPRWPREPIPSNPRETVSCMWRGLPSPPRVPRVLPTAPPDGKQNKQKFILNKRCENNKKEENPHTFLQNLYSLDVKLSSGVGQCRLVLFCYDVFNCFVVGFASQAYLDKYRSVFKPRFTRRDFPISKNRIKSIQFYQASGLLKNMH